MKIKNKFHCPIRAFIDFKKWQNKPEHREQSLKELFKDLQKFDIIKSLNIYYGDYPGELKEITIKPV